MFELILGGVRSGKSALAERLAAESGLAVTYVATGEGLDAEMQARIQQHQARRPSEWQLREEPLALARVLRESAARDRCLLVDCLSLWVSNLLLQENPERLTAECEALLACLGTLPGRVLLVSTEAGLGLLPMGALSRRFLDELGRLHQRLALQADRVLLCVAGLPMLLKGDVL